jgi:O-antigen ligase
MLARALIELSRWALLALLVFAPWAFGSTRLWAIDWLNAGLAAMLAVRGLALLCGGVGRLRELPRVLVFAVGALLVLGWWMTLNARALYDPEFSIFAPLPVRASFAPGAVDAALALAAMTRLSLLLGALLLTCELAAESTWRLRLWTTIALTGASIAALGVVQRAAAAPTIFWENPSARGPDSYSKIFFATFYYHANAGAFLNLCLPAAVTALLRAFSRRTPPLSLALWIASLVMYVLAAVMNTSRAGQIIAGALALALLLWPARGLLAFTWMRHRRTLAWGIGMVGLVLVVVLLAIGLQLQIGRWQETARQVGTGSLLGTRLLAQSAALQAVPDAGAFGFGPGCFQVMFPYYTNFLGDRIEGIWRYLHADYLQTLLEWGVLGTALWSLIFFGGVARGVTHYRTPESGGNSQHDLLLPAALLALAGVAVHALIDFPLQIASIQLYVVVYLGLCWGWMTTASGGRRRRHRTVA